MQGCILQMYVLICSTAGFHETITPFPQDFGEIDIYILLSYIICLPCFCQALEPGLEISLWTERHYVRSVCLTSRLMF